MSQEIQVNQGELYVHFTKPTIGKVSFADLGFKKEDLILDGGFLRMVFDLEGIGEHEYYAVPTIEVEYTENMAETHWICDFNEETILDKTDHYGHSTIILMNRKKLASLEHHHMNKLVLHAEFPDPAHLVPEKCFINFFK
ncbi:MAG: cytochrome P450 [Crocinitomicaceae bacterium]|nr:cytochrome P450 [Crocinitomicaceae bacterium]